MKVKIFLLFLSAYIFSGLCFATNVYKPSEKIRFEHIRKKDGLSSDYVTCIYQDSRGHLWIGTKDGLNKYDGYSFVNYLYDSRNPNSLAQNWVLSIFEDSSGRLWIVTRNEGRKSKIQSGLCLYNYEKDDFNHCQNNSEISESFITSICEDKSGNIWLGTSNGIYKSDNSHEDVRFSKVHLNSDKYNSRINHIFIDLKSDKNDIWFSSAYGTFIFKDNTTLEKVVVNLNNKERTLTAVQKIIKGENNQLWFASEGQGLYKYNYDSIVVKQYQHESNNRYSLCSNMVYALCRDEENIFWIGTKDGLDKFDAKQNKFICYNYDEKDPYSLSKNKVTTIYKDKTGVIWIGTEGGGINKINKQKNRFTHYKHNSTQLNSLSNNRIWSIYEDSDGLIWLGTQNGLNKFDPINEKFTTYFESREKNQISSENRFWAIMENEDDIWAGTLGDGIYKLNRKTGKYKKFKHVEENPKSISNNFIRLIHKDNYNDIWIGTHGGLYKFNKITKTFTQFIHNPDANSISHDKILTMIDTKYYDKEELWIGTQGGGLNKFDKTSQKFTHYKSDPRNEKSLSNNNVWLLYQDRMGDLWISTLAGLNKYDREKENFIRYKFDRDTIANDLIKVIFEDKTGNLWVGGNQGLFKYERSENRFVDYHDKFGIPRIRVDAILEDNSGFLWINGERYLIKFNQARETYNVYELDFDLENHPNILTAYLKSTDGKFIIAGQNGFLMFNPNKIKENIVVPQIVLTDFKVFNKSVAIGDSRKNTFSISNHISQISLVKIPYDKNVFSIEFSALDFLEPFKNKYAYKLDGIDPDWIYTDANRRFATYNQLNPGDYTFYVRGSNNDGIWNSEGKSLRIIVTPLWWQTVWFKSFVVFLLIGIVFWIYYNRINALKKKHKIQKEFSRQLINSQETERKRIASALHDSHGQNLLVISNEVQYFVQQHHEFENDLKPVSGIIQESIDEIRAISYDLHPHQLDRLGLVKTIKSMIKKISGSNKISFFLDLDEVDGLLNKNDEINLYRIIQEATNNIIKHSGATEAEIKLERNLNTIELTISDNGNGFEKQEKLKTASGLGLSGMQERANLINAKFIIESKPGEGTLLKIVKSIN